MKAINTLLILCLLAFQCGAVLAQTSLEGYGLRGQVRSISTRSELANHQNVAKQNPKSSSLLFFTPNGMLIESRFKGTDGIEQVHREDGKDNTLEDLSYGADGSLLSRTTYTHDSEGRTLESFTYDGSNTLEHRTVNTYDSVKHLRERIEYNPDGSLNGCLIFNFDDQGNMIESVSREANGSVAQRTEFRYDSDRQIVEEFNYSGDGSLILSSKYTENREGRSRLSETYTPDHTLISKITSVVNYKGELVELSRINADGSLKEKMVCTFRYDLFGNWIEKVTSKTMPPNGKTILEEVEVSRREIVYY